MKKAYILLIVLFIAGFISSVLTLTILWINYYTKITYNKISNIKTAKEFYSILDEVLVFFTGDIETDYVSPYDGWFKELPDSIKGYQIRYIVEDSKIDINHLDFNNLSSEYFKSNISLKYFYEENEISEAVTDKYKTLFPDIFSIFITPNFNTVDINKLKIFLQSGYFEETSINNILERIKYFRGFTEKYLTVNNFIIDEDKFLNIKSYINKNDENLFYLYFDYTGSINLNFVNQDVFNIAYTLVTPQSSSENRSYISSTKEQYWNKIITKREYRSTIKDLKEIFEKDSDIYKKIFSVNSRIFLIKIEKGQSILCSLIKKYRNYRGISSIQILKNKFITEGKSKENTKNE